MVLGADVDPEQLCGALVGELFDQPRGVRWMARAASANRRGGDDAALVLGHPEAVERVAQVHRLRVDDVVVVLGQIPDAEHLSPVAIGAAIQYFTTINAPYPGEVALPCRSSRDE